MLISSHMHRLALSTLLLTFVMLGGCATWQDITPASSKALQETRQTLAELAVTVAPDTSLAYKAQDQANERVDVARNFVTGDALGDIVAMGISFLFPLLAGGVYHQRKVSGLKKLARVVADQSPAEAHATLSKKL